MTVATNALLEGTRRAHRARRHRGLHRRRRARPPGAAATCTGCAPRTPRRSSRPSGASRAPERTAPDGVLRALDGPGRARRRGRRRTSPRRSRSCLLHAYRHPEHERALGDALRERLGDDVHVSLSHEVVGTFREYERAATTEVDAALSPLLARYLRRAARRARDEAGLPEPAIMQSSGGLADAATRGRARGAHRAQRPGGRRGGGGAARRAAAASPTCSASTWAARRATSASSRTARVRETAGREVGGRPLALPMVDIHTVGAGGGSIAWRDAGGALRVGPRSGGRRARARPATAAAAPSRRSPTPTSSSAALDAGGRSPAASSSTPTPRRARSAALGRRAGPRRRATCAAGIVRVANAEMVRALRVMTVERGLDPRDFALLAFGGAGPLHAARDRRGAGHRRRSSCRARRACSARSASPPPTAARDSARTRAARRRLRAPTTCATSCAARRRAERGRLRPALPRPVARADRPRRATRPTRCARRSRPRTRSATATATPTADVELVTVRATQRRARPGRRPRRDAAGERASSGAGASSHLPEATLVVARGLARRRTDDSRDAGARARR